MVEENNGTRSENIAKEFRVYFEPLLNRDPITKIGEQENTIYYTAEPEVLSLNLEEVQYVI